MKWPRLSQTLPPARALYACQRCGGATALARWMEHDDRDNPEKIIVVLCGACSAIIEPHPRLYSKLHKWHPWPGAMTVCADCSLRDGVRCTGSDPFNSKQFTYPEPTVMFVDGVKGGRRTGWRETIWHGPVTACAMKRTPVLSPEDAAQWQRLCAMVERGGNDGADVFEAEEWCKTMESKYGQPFSVLIRVPAGTTGHDKNGDKVNR